MLTHKNREGMYIPIPRQVPLLDSVYVLIIVRTRLYLYLFMREFIF